MSTEEDRNLAIQKLADDVHAEDGWLSDAQYAQLEWDDSMQVVRFCGEGSIDVGHMVSIVQAGFRRTPAPAPDVQALIDEARQEAGKWGPGTTSTGLLLHRLADALEAAAVSTPQVTEWEYGFDHGGGSICLFDTAEEARRIEGDDGHVVRRAVGPWEPVPTEGVSE